jgi:hypothetical protein
MELGLPECGTVVEIAPETQIHTRLDSRGISGERTMWFPRTDNASQKWSLTPSPASSKLPVHPAQTLCRLSPLSAPAYFLNLKTFRLIPASEADDGNGEKVSIDVIVSRLDPNQPLFSIQELTKPERLLSCDAQSEAIMLDPRQPGLSGCRGNASIVVSRLIFLPVPEAVTGLIRIGKPINRSEEPHGGTKEILTAIGTPNVTHPNWMSIPICIRNTAAPVKVTYIASTLPQRLLQLGTRRVKLPSRNSTQSVEVRYPTPFQAQPVVKAFISGVELSSSSRLKVDAVAVDEERFSLTIENLSEESEGVDDSVSVSWIASTLPATQLQLLVCDARSEPSPVSFSAPLDTRSALGMGPRIQSQVLLSEFSSEDDVSIETTPAKDHSGISLRNSGVGASGSIRCVLVVSSLPKAILYLGEQEIFSRNPESVSAHFSLLPSELPPPPGEYQVFLWPLAQGRNAVPDANGFRVNVQFCNDADRNQLWLLERASVNPSNSVDAVIGFSLKTVALPTRYLSHDGTLAPVTPSPPMFGVHGTREGFVLFALGANTALKFDGSKGLLSTPYFGDRECATKFVFRAAPAPIARPLPDGAALSLFDSMELVELAPKVKPHMRLSHNNQLSLPTAGAELQWAIAFQQNFKFAQLCRSKKDTCDVFRFEIFVVQNHWLMFKASSGGYLCCPSEGGARVHMNGASPTGLPDETLLWRVVPLECSTKSRTPLDDFVKDVPYDTSSLGKGCWGSTQRVVSLLDGQRYAMKVFNNGYSSHKKMMARELSALGTLPPHPNLLRFNSSAVKGDKLIVVTNFVDGVTVARSGELFPRPTVAQCLKWTHEIFGALATLHHHRPVIVHRDIHDGNVMVSREGHIVLLDFGNATLKETPASIIDLKAAGEDIGGIMAFFSPERRRGQPFTEKDDVWAAALVIVQLSLGGLKITQRSGCGRDAMDFAIQPDAVQGALSDVNRVSPALRLVLEPALRSDFNLRSNAYLISKAALDQIQSLGTTPFE